MCHKHFQDYLNTLPLTEEGLATAKNLSKRANEIGMSSMLLSFLTPLQTNLTNINPPS
jgi:hypothetical protein